MTATIKFITDAVAGGYKPEHYICSHCEEMMMSCDKLEVEKALLDPACWQAVGKTRGWKDRSEGTFDAEMSCWQAYWRGFFEHLADGKSIEESLTAITN